MCWGDIMTEELKFTNRLASLRQQKGVSAREMSLSLGQSESYINKIENNKALPSLMGFFYICDYLDISPMNFFDYKTDNPKLSEELINEIRHLDYAETNHILEIVKDINKRKK